MPSPTRTAAQSTPRSGLRSNRRRGAPTHSAPRSWFVPRAHPESPHHLEERGLEFVHLLLCADRNADVRRPGLPDAADIDFLFLEGVLDLLPGTFHVDHEFVRDRR